MRRQITPLPHPYRAVDGRLDRRRALLFLELLGWDVDVEGGVFVCPEGEAFFDLGSAVEWAT